MKTIQELADIGAKAASEKLATLKGGGSGLLLAISPNSSGWSNDQPAREAFAQAVIDAFLDGVGDVPSVDECREMFDAEPSHKELQGLSVVLAAVAKTTRNWQIAASARERMLEERVKDLEAMNKRQRDDMADVANRLGVYEHISTSDVKIHDLNAIIQRQEAYFDEIKAERDKAESQLAALVGAVQSNILGRHPLKYLCLQFRGIAGHLPVREWFKRIKAALPPVVDKEREAFEEWAKTPLLRNGGSYDNTQTQAAWAAWQAARKQPAS